MLTCSICNQATVANVDEAIEKEWLPCWFKGEDQQNPCCGACAQFLQDAGDGEMELIPGIDPLPEPPAPVMTLHDIDYDRFTAEKDDWQLR